MDQGRELAMYVHEQFVKARHEDMLRAAAKDRFAAQARQEPAAVTAIPHPVMAGADAAAIVVTPRGQRTAHGSNRLAHLALPPRRLLAMVRTRGLRTAR